MTSWKAFVGAAHVLAVGGAIVVLSGCSRTASMSVAAQLLQEANLALDLAQTRYKLGLGSIVELSQAQLQQTDAQIGNANARYDYLATLAALNYQLGR